MKGGYISIKDAAIFWEVGYMQAMRKMQVIAKANNVFKIRNGKEKPDSKGVTYQMFCDSLNISMDYLDTVLQKAKKPTT